MAAVKLHNALRNVNKPRRALRGSVQKNGLIMYGERKSLNLILEKLG